MKSLRWLRLAGAALAMVGSFLPWEKQGDPIPYQTYGIKLFPMVSDYGGALVILLTLTILLLAYRPPSFIKKSSLWNLIISALLMAAALLFVVRWLVHLFEYPAGGIGAPQLEIGLIGVVAGSALLLGIAIRNYRAM
jgi:hypothetical protein